MRRGEDVFETTCSETKCRHWTSDCVTSRTRYHPSCRENKSLTSTKPKNLQLVMVNFLLFGVKTVRGKGCREGRGDETGEAGG